jgi:hypothetical protein
MHHAQDAFVAMKNVLLLWGTVEVLRMGMVVVVVCVCMHACMHVCVSLYVCVYVCVCVCGCVGVRPPKSLASGHCLWCWVYINQHLSFSTSCGRLPTLLPLTSKQNESQQGCMLRYF